MCSYNQVNGTSACHNAALLGPTGLVHLAGFQGRNPLCGEYLAHYSHRLGFVVSDWGATHDSAADNANAGLDMEQPGDNIVIGTLLGQL
jgi:beta-glucosidase